MNNKNPTINKKLIISRVFYGAALFVIVAFGALVVTSSFGNPELLTAYVVQSGSMEPAITTGSMVFVKSHVEYNQGDIITFNQKGENQALIPVTHRVAEVKEQEGIKVFITRGDANNAPDLQPTFADQVIGKVVFTVPYIGYPVGFAKTQIGFIFLIVIPGTLIIYSEVMNIKGEIAKKIKNREKDKEEDMSSVEENSSL